MNKQALRGRSICGVSVVGDNNLLLWRCRDSTGMCRNMFLEESTVSTYVQQELGLRSTQALKTLLLQPKSCSLYFDQELIAIYNYDHLKKGFGYFADGKVHVADDLDKELNLSSAQKSKWNIDNIRIVLNALVSKDYSHVASKLSFEEFDYGVMIMEKLRAQSDYLNPLIVRREIISKMVDVFAELGAVQTYSEKCVSEVCKVALNEVLKLRSNKIREQRDYLFANFNLVNVKVALSAENYEDIIMKHWKLRGMTSKNVESTCQAIDAGGADALTYFCKLLSGEIRKHNLMYSHQRLDYGPRKVLKHIFAKHWDAFDELILGKKLIYERKLTLLLVKLNYAFYGRDAAFDKDTVFTSISQFVDQFVLNNHANLLQKYLDVYK